MLSFSPPIMEKSEILPSAADEKAVAETLTELSALVSGHPLPVYQTLISRVGGSDPPLSMKLDVKINERRPPVTSIYSVANCLPNTLPTRTYVGAPRTCPVSRPTHVRICPPGLRFPISMKDYMKDYLELERKYRESQFLVSQLKDHLDSCNKDRIAQQRRLEIILSRRN